LIIYITSFSELFAALLLVECPGGGLHLNPRPLPGT